MHSIPPSGICGEFLIALLPTTDISDTIDFTGFYGHVTGLLEKAMAPHSSTLAWKIPWTEEPGRLQSMGLLRVGHD